MYGCESWTVKKAERRRIVAFELWCWRRLLRVPWTSRRSSQSILKEISLEYSLEGLMAEGETPNTWLPDAKNRLIWKDPDPGKDWRREGKGMTEDDRGWDGWIASLTQWSWIWVGSGSWWLTGKPVHGVTRVRHDWVTGLTVLWWWTLPGIILLSIYLLKERGKDKFLVGRRAEEEKGQAWAQGTSWLEHPTGLD